MSVEEMKPKHMDADQVCEPKLKLMRNIADETAEPQCKWKRRTLDDTSDPESSRDHKHADETFERKRISKHRLPEKSSQSCQRLPPPTACASTAGVDSTTTATYARPASRPFQEESQI